MEFRPYRREKRTNSYAIKHCHTKVLKALELRGVGAFHL